MHFKTEDETDTLEGSTQEKKSKHERKAEAPASDLERDENQPFEEAGNSEADGSEPGGEADSSEPDSTEPGAEAVRTAGHFPRTRKYLVFWSCYFAAILVFLITQYRQVIGTDLNDRKY